MHPIVDCHCHIYPEKIAAKAVESIGHFYDIPMNSGGTAADMAEAEKKAGITHQIIFSVATKVPQVASINRFIADEVEKSHGTMTGLGTLHPDSEDLKGDIEHIVELGLKGVKLHPDIQGFKIDDYRCLKIYELCEGRLPILMHTGDNRYDFSNPNRLKPVLEIFKNLTVIGAHLGGWSMWDTAVDELAGFKNFYVDCSSSLYAMTTDKAREVIRRYGADRVLFGTDYPMWSPSDEIKRFESLGLNEEEKHKIYYKNAKRLFNLAL